MSPAGCKTMPITDCSFRAAATDNPDQRIQEDINGFAGQTLDPGARPSRFCGDAWLVRRHTLGAIGHARDRGPRYPWLHALGRDCVLHNWHLADKPHWQAVDRLELSAAAIRSQFAFRAGAAARKCRGHRALWGRGDRTKGRRRSGLPTSSPTGGESCAGRSF